MSSEYTLFEEVEDRELRDRNRGVVMVNIYEDYCRDDKMSAAGVAALLGYFKQIPDDEQASAFVMFNTLIQQRGHRGKTVLN